MAENNSRIPQQQELDLLSVFRHEVVREVLKSNPKNRTVKQIAVYFQKAESTVYRWGEDPQKTGIDMPIDEYIELYRFTHAKKLKDWLRMRMEI